MAIADNLKKFDWIFFVSLIFLLFFGLSSIYGFYLNNENLDLTSFNKQLVAIALGLFLFVFLIVIDYRILKNYSVIFYILSCALLVAVLIWGRNIRGTTGWFNFWGFGFQPVEAAKASLVFALAHFYSVKLNYYHWFKMALLTGLVAAVPIVLTILQPDFGSAFVLFFIWASFYAFNCLKKRHIIPIALFLVLLIAILWNFVFIDYQKQRINTFLNPMSDPLGRGYNLRQSLIAVGSGGFLGRGLGLGTQSQLKFLPEISTDFIFANIAETMGFLGAVAVLFLFFIFLFRILCVLKKCRDNFGFFIVYGLGSVYFIHIIFNIGMNIGLFPVAGLPLPFLSCGGSFLIFCLAGAGIIAGVDLKIKNLTTI